MSDIQTNEAPTELLTDAQQELLVWLTTFLRENQHAPSIRQMMRAMKLKSPAPVQSRLEHLRKKGYLDWTEGVARSVRIYWTAEGKKFTFEEQ